MSSGGITDRDFKGVQTPSDIWLDTRLDGDLKIVWTEIYSLDNDFGCTAKNDHFCKMFGMTERTVQRNIKFLKENGYISVDNNKRTDKRTMRILGRHAYDPTGKREDFERRRDDLTERFRKSFDERT